jgi:hypothetical protein
MRGGREVSVGWESSVEWVHFELDGLQQPATPCSSFRILGSSDSEIPGSSESTSWSRVLRTPLPLRSCRTVTILTRSQTSPLIDDAMLKAMAPHLRQLRRLTLWGCTRVTKAGVFALLQESENLEELSIDALPHSVRWIGSFVQTGSRGEPCTVHRSCLRNGCLSTDTLC